MTGAARLALLVVALTLVLGGSALAHDCSSPADCEQTAGYNAVIALAGGALALASGLFDTGNDGLACQKPVAVHDFFGTVFRACGVDGNRSYAREGRKTKYVSRCGNTMTSGNPIGDLF